MIGEDLLGLGGQAALVTGAGQGAGRAIALMLARHNAGGVAVNDFVLERAQAVAAEIEALGVRAVAVQADVGDHASVATAFETARAALGPITLLVNNAGNAGPDATMGFSPPFWETRPDEWDRYFRTNLTGVMNCCHLALPEMVVQKRGRIVTIVSDSGRVGEARRGSRPTPPPRRARRASSARSPRRPGDMALPATPYRSRRWSRR